VFSLILEVLCAIGSLLSGDEPHGMDVARPFEDKFRTSPIVGPRQPCPL
jgi:hypothetical protein